MSAHPRNNGPVSFEGGGYYEPLPLDFEILSFLPEKGLIGGIHWKGRRVRDVAEEVNEGVRKTMLTEGEQEPPSDIFVKSTTIQSRLRAMQVAGLVKGFPGTGQGERIWAKLPKAAELIRHKEAYIG